MILQMTRASPLSFAEFAILSPMSKTDAHSLDPIPDEQFLETHDAAEGKPAGVRFLAFNTVIDIEAYGEAAACRAAFEEARALCRLSLIHIYGNGAPSPSHGPASAASATCGRTASRRPA